MPVTSPPPVAVFHGVRKAAAAVTPFAPTDLSGLSGWWKADSLALSNGASVATWVDSSAAGHDLAQAGGTLQPVYNTAQQNSLPAVTFDGVNDYMATSAFASPTAGCSVFVVQKLTALDQYRTVLCHAAAATWVSPFARVLTRVTDTAGGNLWQFIVQDATDAASTLTEASQATTTWQLMEFVYDQTNMTIFRTAAQVAAKARAGALTSSTQPVFIGADTTLADNYKGQIGELVYYNRGLNGTERGQVETYLRAKWSV